ncbi:MAG: hypothetical protein WDA11_11020 [Thiohalomonadaceae bacterium]
MRKTNTKSADALKRYPASAAGLIKHCASSFPTFKAQISLGRSVDEVFVTLSPGDVDALLEHAVARYYETSGLFGTLERCEAMVERCKAIGVDEIACLIDFGMAAKVAEEHLHRHSGQRQAGRRGLKGQGGRDIPGLAAPWTDARPREAALQPGSV